MKRTNDQGVGKREWKRIMKTSNENEIDNLNGCDKMNHNLLPNVESLKTNY